MTRTGSDGRSGSIGPLFRLIWPIPQAPGSRRQVGSARDTAGRAPPTLWLPAWTRNPGEHTASEISFPLIGDKLLQIQVRNTVRIGEPACSKPGEVLVGC